MLMDAINKAKRTSIRSQTTKVINKIKRRILKGDTDIDELEEEYILAELHLKEKY